MADKIKRAVQVAGRWYNEGDEADLRESAAQENHFERWRIDGSIEGFEGAGEPDQYESDKDVKKRQRRSPPK